MITKVPKLTRSGQNMLLRALAGEAIQFTRFKIGNGELPVDNDGTELTDLINPLVLFGISDCDDSNEGYLMVTGHFNSSDVPSEMKFRELGIFAQGEDEVEKLYAYINDGDDAGSLTPSGSDIYSEQEITLVIAIGEAEHVTAMLVPDTLYAPKSDFDDHVADQNNPHEVTKEQIGLGEVPNVSTNNQTPTYSAASALGALASGEKMSTAFGKISKAVTSLISHLGARNPHGITAEQIGLGNVPNVTTNDQTPTYTVPNTLYGISSGDKMSNAFGQISRAIILLKNHLETMDPHRHISLKGIWSPNYIDPIYGFTICEPEYDGAPPSSSGDTIFILTLIDGINSSYGPTQIGFVFNGNGGNIYFRMKNKGTNEWTSWR